MLPGLDGLSIVKAVRGAGRKMPVLFLTALGGVDDRVDGLDAGGDDYLVKPFAFSELMARVHALARRPHIKEEETKLKVADLEMDLISRKVTRAGEEIELQPRGFRLLEVLMRNKGRVLTRTMLRMSFGGSIGSSARARRPAAVSDLASSPPSPICMTPPSSWPTTAPAFA